MIGFENFDIGAWSIEGLTQHVRTVSKWVSRKTSSWPAQATLVGAMLVTSGVGYGGGASAVVASSPMFIAESVAPVSADSAGRDMIAGSPAQFWTNLSSEVTTWKQLDEPAMPDFEPFI